MANQTNLIVRGGADFSGLKKEMSKMQNSLKSFQMQSNAITSSLRKIGTIAAAAFGVRALINFSKESIKLASDMEEVQNVVDTAFGEMAYRMEEFANKSIEMYGISRLTAKQTGSSYMAMAVGMRFAAEQASDMALQLTALSADMASFYNISQSEAKTALSAVFTGETESLKRYGILITEVNLQEYARQQGITKSIQKMTQQEKALLRYNYVLDATKLAQGDFARTSDSWVNQTKILSERWKEFKGIMGQGLIQALTPVIKVINSIISGLTTFATYFSAVMSTIFGSQKKNTASSQQQSGAIGAAVENQEALTAATKETGKAASKTLANFDELNILQEDSAGIAGAVDPAVTAGGSGFEGGELLAGTTLSPTVQTAVDSLVNLLKPLQDIKLDPLKESLGRLWEQVKQFSGSTGAGLYWLTQYVLIPLSELHVKYTLPSLFDRISDSLEVINGEIALIQPIWEWFDKNVLDRIRELDNTAFGETLKQFFGDFSAETFLRSTGAIGQVVLLLSDTKGWLDSIKSVLPLVTKGFKDSWEGIKKDWSPVTSWFDANVVTPLSIRFNEYWDELTTSAIYTWGEIQKEWAQASGWFDGNVIKPISQGFKDFCNYLISAVEGFINGFIKGVNEIKAELNELSFDIPDWVPVIGGNSFGFNFSMAPPISIPRLANGAVIPPNSEFLAVLGDQKRGMNIEAPLDTIVAAFNTALDNRGNQGGGDITIRFEGSMAQFVRELKPYIDKENRRVGRVLIQGV